MGRTPARAVRNGESQNEDFPSQPRWIIDSKCVAVLLAANMWAN